MIFSIIGGILWVGAAAATVSNDPYPHEYPSMFAAVFLALSGTALVLIGIATS